jgi:Eco57I restriction-modification methylase
VTQYIGIRSEGGLVPYDILNQIAGEESGFGQQAKDFGLAAGRRLTDEITRAWSDTQDYWHIFQRRSEGLPESETGTTLTRKWVTDLLNELLGYELTYQPAGAVIGGKTYPISHRAGAGEESPPIDIESFRTDLDRRPQGRRLSPQALVQEYLNNSDEHLWGIVTNGSLLRLLRDTSRTSRPSYLEFDLQSILDGNRFNEFSLFYRVCHRSRLPKTADDSTSCWLERYFQLSIEQGGRVRDKLRDGVEDALKNLGTGLLRHPKNDALREKVRSGALSAHEFHRQLLRLVYRLLFLMVAEERRMIVPEAPDSERRQSLYDAHYSIGRLRTLAEKVIERSTFGDLWLSLQRTFALFENGDSNPLGIPPLNGDLFSALAVKDLQDTQLYNDDLLAAVRRLSLFEEKRVLQRVNYAALDVEELGSVYESLLDFQPVFVDEAEGKKFDLRAGSERKSTGSYYTRPELVRELIESALVPVMQDRLANAKDNDPTKDKEKKQEAVLTMSVCDPACGSGHFLLAAARRLGRELAKVKTGEEEPTPKEFHLAVRDVISHCVYGVDVNPLAVDLCKLALWLEGHWTGKPLSFLDHRIKCGNSLIGVLDPSVLEDGIPDDAFTPVTGDDKKVASAFKKKNKDERKGQPSLPFDAAQHVHQFAADSGQLLGILEDTPADVRRKEEIYRRAREQREWLHDWTAANLWTAAFFVPFTKYDDPEVPTHEKFMDYLLHGKDRPQMTGYANALSVERRFFHWRLEFPDVFDKGGFDVVLGNPPWERIRLEEQEHWAYDPYIAKARNKAERLRRIEEYRESKDVEKCGRVRRFEEAKKNADALSRFVRACGRFPLTAVGDVNTYALFADLASQALNTNGRAGVLLPIGIATDDTTKDFFGNLTDKQRLASLTGYENEAFIFPAVHHSFKFCAFTMTGSHAKRVKTDFVFFCRQFQDVSDHRRHFELSNDDLKLLNPNTRTCPIFRTRSDADLTKKIYRRVPLLLNEVKNENPWGIGFLRMFDLSNDSHLFKTESNSGLLPLYEAKMMHQFDHRYGTYEGATQAQLNVGTLPQPGESQKQDPNFIVVPRYWISKDETETRWATWKHRWVIGFRDITSSVVERTSIFAMLPRVAMGNSLPLVLPTKVEPQLAACLLANLNSIILDYVARQKIAGTHMNFFFLQQLPILGPETYSHSDVSFILRHVLELIYTAWDLKPFAEEVGYSGEPFRWHEKRRVQVHAELDAYYAHLYGLTRDELRYVLDPKDVFGEDFPSETFRVLKEWEEKESGEYRTRRLVLEAFDKLSESPRFHDEVSKRESAVGVPEMAAQSRN